MSLDLKHLSWMRQGACLRLSAEQKKKFFSEGGKKGDVAVAKQVCHGCPVEKQCLDYAVEEAVPFGVWGGTSARERLVMIRNRRREARDLERVA